MITDMMSGGDEEVIAGRPPGKPRRRLATRSMQIDAGLVDALAALAEQKRNGSSHDGSRGPRVTIRALVEEAVLDKWPELRAAAGVLNDPAAAGATLEEAAAAQGQLWSAILQAVYGGGSSGEQAAAIDALEGSIVGNFGERLGLRELAYHLRGSQAATAVIGSLADLVRDFEQMGGGSGGVVG